jgi:hydrogenase expression/formation protein HypD
MAVWQARQQGLKNFSILVSHVLVPPSIASILQSPLNRVQGFLGPGHVRTVMGYREYEPIARRFRVPIVITGFERLDLLQGTLMAVRQGEAGEAQVENEFRDHDAERLFEIEEIDTQEPAACMSGLVLKGVKKPHDCPAFGKQCTPEHPLGATMVFAEGACAAYCAYGRHLEPRCLARERVKKRALHAAE